MPSDMPENEKPKGPIGRFLAAPPDGVAKTIIVAVSLCLVASLVVSAAAVSLRPTQEVNEVRNGEAFEVKEAAKQSILDAGGTNRQLDAAQRQEWVDTMAPVWDQFREDVGQENIDAAQSVNANF